MIFKGVHSVVRSKNTLVYVFLCFWLDCEQCHGSQPKTQMLKTYHSLLSKVTHNL